MSTLVSRHTYLPCFPPTTPPQSVLFDQVPVDNGCYAAPESGWTQSGYPAASCSQQWSIPQIAVPPSDRCFPSTIDLADPPNESNRRQALDHLQPPGTLLPEARWTAPRKPMDMNMASTGSLAAKPGSQTPLASYTAQMLVWLWFGDHSPAPPTPSSTASSPELSSDPFDTRKLSSPLNPLQVQPSAAFAEFVARMLRITMVSHSVTLVALLYVYRLKMRNNIQAGEGSEQRPFVASLILSNKYLDDNTYTNATWAELAGISVAEINKMEEEFLRGLRYDLGVQHSEYVHWRNLLDGYINARQREAGWAQRSRTSQWATAIGSSPTLLHTPTCTLSPGESDMYRTRSTSPPCWSSALACCDPYINSPGAARKRTAGDAFDTDMPTTTSMYEHMRLPARRIHSSQPFGHHFAPLSISAVRQPSVGRSSSLSRHIARLPGGNCDRRGSAGHIDYAPEPDLMHAAMQQQFQVWQPPPGQDPEDYTALVAPYERLDNPQVIPPEHLIFYTLAAESHPGQDGAPRKAILHHQEPSQNFAYAQQLAVPGPTLAVANPAYTYNKIRDPLLDYSAQSSRPASSRFTLREMQNSLQDETFDYTSGATYPSTAPLAYPYSHHNTSYVDNRSYVPAEPEPAEFANAGPPGYYYNSLPPAVPVQSSNRWSIGSDEHVYTYPGIGDGVDHSPTAWRAKSEWNSPMPGAFDRTTWR